MEISELLAAKGHSVWPTTIPLADIPMEIHQLIT